MLGGKVVGGVLQGNGARSLYRLPSVHLVTRENGQEVQLDGDMVGQVHELGGHVVAGCLVRRAHVELVLRPEPATLAVSAGAGVVALVGRRDELERTHEQAVVLDLELQAQLVIGQVVVLGAELGKQPQRLHEVHGSLAAHHRAELAHKRARFQAGGQLGRGAQQALRKRSPQDGRRGSACPFHACIQCLVDVPVGHRRLPSVALTSSKGRGRAPSNQARPAPA